MTRIHLSANFTTDDLNWSSTAVKHGIVNIAPAAAIERAKLLAEYVLQPVRDHFGLPIRPNSWYRCEELEKLIAAGGYNKWLRRHRLADTSEAWKKYFATKQHPTGSATDFEIPSISNDEVFNFIRNSLHFDQLIRENAKHGVKDSGWIHVSYIKEGNRNQVLHEG